MGAPGSLQALAFWLAIRPWTLGIGLAAVTLLISAEVGRIIARDRYTRLVWPIRIAACHLLLLFALGIGLWIYAYYE